MGHILNTALTMTALLGVFCGCDKDDPTPDPQIRTNSTYAIVVGMETSKFAGSCDGAGYDADRMYNLFTNYTPNVVKMRDGNGTKANVAKAFADAIEKAGKDGLVIFYYSGHGGSDPFKDTGIEEDDGKDEYLCLYDTYMRDNEIWNIISKSKGRICLIFDCCHSQTMMRSPSFRVIPPLTWDHTMTDSVPFSMLCWSGCPDDTYSYGSATGGQFTNALLRHFNANKTYEQLWTDIKNDRTLRRFENPQSTVLGNGFEGKAVFK